MGIDREQHQDESPSEISGQLKKIFGIENQEAYHIWTSYNARRLAGYSPKDAIESVKRGFPISKEYVFDYFITLALETINAEVIKES